MGLALVALSRRRFGPATNMRLPYEHFSFSLSGLALPRTTNHYQRQSGSTLVGRLRDDLAEMLRSRRAQRGGVLTSGGEAGAG
jgi:hypothetical protein